ncbi:MAG TPA: hypothetical protein VHF92_06075 [Geodermatophilus sp.]|nr:hypothetical protein [Geodermatophilus sp.]
MSRTRSPAVRPLVLALRLVGAALLAAMAGIHLYLWAAGYRDIPTIGPLFLVNVVAGGVLCLAVLAAPWRWLAVVAALGALLQAGTLGALLLSVWVGLFGFVESTRATLFWPSVWVEVVGAGVLAALALLRVRTRASASDPAEPARTG